MCREGFAVPYFGGNKAKLKAKHMANRRKLIKAGIKTKKAIIFFIKLISIDLYF